MNEKADCLIFELRKYKQAVIESIDERNMQTIKANNQFLIKAHEDFISCIISETEYKIFKKGFSSQIQAAENDIDILREELSRLDKDKYIAKIIERFFEYKNIMELNRSVLLKLIKSVIVIDSDNINIEFRYLGDFPVQGQNNG